MATPETSREPCPDRIIDDVGGAFGMGANSPNGHRLAGGAASVRMLAPRAGGSFAVWGGLFSTFDCALVYALAKEDPWNSIASGAATGGCARASSPPEGRRDHAQPRLGRPAAPEELLQYPGQDPGQHAPPSFLGVSPAPPIAVHKVPVPDSGSSSTGWLGGLFGKKKKGEGCWCYNGDRKSEVLEMDLPPTAVPSFDYK
ncbi:hypothetical protein PVAP13_9KG387900 [Panicum virgatum]|uniref:Uncharacterized protein n=1 Tax=Panicum virgatum TaxID=38727 RepID=A0A8T0NX47_PANVG|nr:hypothetical protein PVAP13_9KG387900 [Panicum virgatum]